MKTKCHVLLLAQSFGSDHARAGEPTEFPAKVQGYEKIHTLRENYPFWKARIEDVMAGRAYLSIRVWTGRPYRSKQRELFRLDHRHGVGIQCVIKNTSGLLVDRLAVPVAELAENDGLKLLDFQSWFRHVGIGKRLALIHFTDFRYEENGETYLQKIGIAAETIAEQTEKS